MKSLFYKEPKNPKKCGIRENPYKIFLDIFGFFGSELLKGDFRIPENTF